MNPPIRLGLLTDAIDSGDDENPYSTAFCLPFAEEDIGVRGGLMELLMTDAKLEEAAEAGLEPVVVVVVLVGWW
jgi:hypothetical protein